MDKMREEGEHVTTVINCERVYMEDLIMEKVLGRKLKNAETVFHANGNTLDNRRDNLQLVTFGIDLASREEISYDLSN